MNCPHCNADIAEGLKRCPHCGKSLVRPVVGHVQTDQAWWRRMYDYEKQDMIEWCRSKQPWARVLVLLYLGWCGWDFTWEPGAEGIFAGLNLGIHEAGHLLTAALPAFICAIMGSVLQCAVPIITIFIFRKQRDWFGIAFAIFWLGTNINYVAWYMADARAMAHPLVSIGHVTAYKEDIHDWHVVLKTVGLLNFDTMLAFMTRIVAWICLWGGWALGAYQCWLMYKK